MASNQLPFERGHTLNEGRTLTAIESANLLGKRYVVSDSVHGTGQPVELIVLANDSGSAQTVARKCIGFGTAALDFGRYTHASFYQPTKGAVSIPLDDAYTNGGSIPAYDLFYGVIRGPCYILSTSAASATTMTQHEAVTVAAAGRLDPDQAGAGHHVIGRLDAVPTATSTATVVHIDITFGGGEGT